MSNNLSHQNKDILTTLDNIPISGSCVIVSCTLPTSLRLRLEEMGLTAGTEVTILKAAPLGDPLEIRVRGYSLCIRKETAHCFTVTTYK